MATISQSAIRFQSSSSTSLLFLNNPDIVADPMVLNSVNPGDNKTRNEVYSLRISTTETSKMETRKILTQEITLTSKAPLKILELLESSTNSGSIDDCLISECCKYLKNKGKDLDHGPNVVALNHYFDTIRNLSRNTSVDSATRMKLLEIIELRARNWKTTEELEEYYIDKNKASLSKSRDSQKAPVNLSTSTSSPSLTATRNFIINNNISKQSSPESTETAVSPSSSGDLIKHSGKFQRPVKVPGKNFLKDEFVIKNSDSGKVMGIKGRRVHLIEELSDTVISFQRVNPGAKDRLLQITGPDEASINKAKYYIEDTIKRNASPIPFDQQYHHQPIPLIQSRHKTSASTPAVNKILSDDEPNATFAQTISIGNEVLVISSSLPKLTQEAKEVLEEYFQRSKTETSFTRYDSESDDSDISAITVQKVEPRGNNEQYLSGSDSVSPSEHKSTNNTNFYCNGSTSEKKCQKSASHGSLATSSNFFTKQSKDLTNNSKKIVYNREFLLQCANSELSKVQPHAIKIVTKQIPDIARKQRQTRANSVESAVIRLPASTINKPNI